MQFYSFSGIVAEAFYKHRFKHKISENEITLRRFFKRLSFKLPDYN
jgi:hypothetical protein